MPTTYSDDENIFQKPGNYRIKVQGRLDESWSARLSGMRITGGESADSGQAILEGHLRDQAQLSGVLTTLYDLHLTILSVELLPLETTNPEK